MVARTVGTADLGGAAQHVGKLASILFSEHSFLGADTEDDLLLVTKRRPILRQERTRKLKASKAKNNLCRRKYDNLTVRHQPTYMGDRLRKSFPSRFFICAVHKSRHYIASVATINLAQ